MKTLPCAPSWLLRPCLCLACLLALWGTPRHAAAIFTEDFSMAGLLEQIILQNKSLAETLAATRTLVSQGSEMVNEAKKMADAIGYTATVVRNPDPTIAAFKEDWQGIVAKDFPEKQQLEKDLQEFRCSLERLRKLRDKDADLSYDPKEAGKHGETVFRLAKKVEQTLEQARGAQREEMKKALGEAQTHLAQNYGKVVENLQILQTEPAGTLTLNEVTRHTARNAGQGALAQIRSTALLLQILHEQQTQRLDDQLRSRTDLQALERMRAPEKTLARKSWRLHALPMAARR